MRVLAALLFIGCGSNEVVPSPPDAAEPTCATTSCVPGATCKVPNGNLCKCYDAGEWSCGWSMVDAGVRDATLTVITDAASCESRPSACVDGDHSALHEQITLCVPRCAEFNASIDKAGCPSSITFDGDWTETARACVIGRINAHAWCPGGGFGIKRPCSPD